MNRSRPQRLTPPAPLGSLLKRATVPTATARTSSFGDADYLALVRQCPCLHCGLDPSGEAAHVRLASAAYRKSSGMGKRPEDRWSLPLCREDHLLARHAQHNRNEGEFWESLGINPLLACERLYAQRGDLVAMRAVCFVVISERSLRRE